MDVWSLGVVLYICLCGFPPFADELYSAENPYTLSQQIKEGRFDYPSPYWDPVSDMALNLIDRMLTVDVDERISIDECLEHPWTTQRELDPSDSTDGLTGALGDLDFSKRKPHRERTLLSAFNAVKASRVIPLDKDGPELRLFEKNPEKQKEQEAPTATGQPEDSMHAGPTADQPLFANDITSQYAPNAKT